MKKLVLLSGLLAATLAAAQNDPAVLMQADRDFAKAVAAQGIEGWMSFMAEQAVLLRTHPIMGKDAIRKSMEPGFASPGFKLTWTPVSGQLFQGGILGYTTGRYEAQSKNAKGEVVTSRGTYLTVWQKQPDGAWKVVWDGGSPDPAGSPKPGA